jgi:hypothetical protein
MNHPLSSARATTSQERDVSCLAALELLGAEERRPEFEVRIAGASNYLFESIRAVEATGKPFRVKITGSNLLEGLTVLIGGDPTPWTNVVRPSDSTVVLKKGQLLRDRFPKGAPVTVRVVNPDGGSVEAVLVR